MAKILGAHIPAEIKNLAINGGMDFWQRVEGNTTTVNTAVTTKNYTADMMLAYSQGATNKNYSVARSTDTPTLVQSNYVSTYSYLFTMLTGIASPAAGDITRPFSYLMEGLDYKKIHSKTVTFGFWCKASVAGTYSFCLLNSAGNRNYTTTFSIPNASTWQFTTLTITLDNTGTWNFDNTIGLYVIIGAVAGSTFTTSTLNQWTSSEGDMASGATNWMATTNATFQVTQLSIVEGGLGLGAFGFTRAGKTVQQELALCQRYYAKTYVQGTAPGSVDLSFFPITIRSLSNTSEGNIWANWSYPVTMRISPTVTIYSPNSGASGKLFDVDGAADLTSLVGATGAQSATIQNLNATTLGHNYTAHATAEAGF